MMESFIHANIMYYSTIIDDVCRIIIFPITHTTLTEIIFCISLIEICIEKITHNLNNDDK